MSSTALPPEAGTSGAPYRSGFDPDMRGRPAECDGGQLLVGTKYAGRQEFSGRLTGDYRNFGQYPWRWYLMADLTVKPAAYLYPAVWCEEASLTFLDEDQATIGIEP